MKYSKQRELILRVIRENRIHPTANWVWQKASETMPALGIATVYRNLNALAECGEIIRIPGEEGQPDRFDGVVCEHYHMRCEKCGRILDLAASNQKDLEHVKEALCSVFEVQPEVTALNSVLFNGLCPDCDK